MKIHLLTCLTVLAITSSDAQVTYQKTFGGLSFDVCNNAALTNDSGYILTGFTESFGSGSRDLFLVRTNASGDTLWTAAYGGAQSDEGNTVTETFDGGIAAAGYTGSFGTTTLDIYILKTNSTGDLLWSKRFDSSGDDLAFSIQQTSDSGFILTGSTSIHGTDDVSLIKLNSTGDTLWTKCFMRLDDDVGFSVTETYDEGFLITGQTHIGIGGVNMFLIKTNSVGEIQWENLYGGNAIEYGLQVQQSADSGCVVVGSSSSNSGFFDFSFLKTDSAGNTEFMKVYEASGEASSIIQMPDGYLLSGSSNNFGAFSTDGYLIRTDLTGNPVWAKTFGSPNAETASTALPATGEGYVVCGNTTGFGGGLYDAYMIRTDSSGSSGCNDTTRTVPNILPGFTASPANFIETLYAPSGFSTATQTAKGSSVYNICFNDVVGEYEKTDFDIFPNPSSGQFTLVFDKTTDNGKINVSNILGETFLEVLVIHEHQIQIRLENGVPGIYFLTFTDNERQRVRKIILQ